MDVLPLPCREFRLETGDFLVFFGKVCLGLGDLGIPVQFALRHSAATDAMASGHSAEEMATE